MVSVILILMLGPAHATRSTRSMSRSAAATAAATAAGAGAGAIASTEGGGAGGAGADSSGHLASAAALNMVVDHRPMAVESCPNPQSNTAASRPSHCPRGPTDNNVADSLHRHYSEGQSKYLMSTHST